jgi:tRNA-dihydrouridine synthase
VNESDGFRHAAPAGSAAGPQAEPRAVGRERWVINKVRALMSWYSKGLDAGSHLRVRVNTAGSLRELHDIIDEFFFRADFVPA